MAQTSPILNIDGPTIDAGSYISNVIDCQGGNIIVIYTPDEWTPANLSFLISRDSTNWGRLYHGDTEVVVACGPGRGVIVAIDLPGIAYVRFRSGHGDFNVAQEAERRFRMIVETRPTAMTLDEPDPLPAARSPRSPTDASKAVLKKPYSQLK